MAFGGTLNFQLGGAVTTFTLTNSSGAVPAATYVAGGAVTFPVLTSVDFGIILPSDDQYTLSAIQDGIQTLGQTIGLTGGEYQTYAPSATLVKAMSQFSSNLDVPNVVAVSGAAQAIPDPISSSRVSRITLTAACTLTFPVAAVGKTFRVFLIQDATGSRLVTWPATAKWAGSVAPTLTITAAKTDSIYFYCYDGTNWIGNVIALNF